MRKNGLSDWAQLAVFFLISLLPWWWLRGNYVILGHDAGFPLSPWIHFIDRLFTWTHRYGLGNEQAIELGGFFIHGFEGAISWLGFSLNQVQGITFSVYFFGFAFSAWILARELFPERKRLLPLFAGFIYAINHFILQAWFIVERTKFTLYIALPLILALIYRVARAKLNPLPAGIIAAFLIFFLNGGGFFPLYGAIMICVPAVFLALIAMSQERLELCRRLLFFSGVWTIASILLNAYWIFPYVKFFQESFGSELALAGGESGVVAWVQSISFQTSFFNLMRLQGVPEWYANPLHPYARTYLENNWVIIVSYAIPSLAFSSMLFLSHKEKIEKKSVIAIFFMTLVGLLFTAGSHPPFGYIYIWLIEHVPGFVIFRTPFYKFAPSVWLGYALLIAYTLDELISRLKISQRMRLGLIALCLVSWSVYHYPFFTGIFFDYEVGQKTTKVLVPQYVFDFARYANGPDFPYRRILLLPGQNASTHFEAYTWGYWSLAQIQSLLTNRSFIGNSAYKSTTEEIFIKNVYDLIRLGDPSWVDHVRYLFVDAILLRQDFDYSLKGSETTNPQELMTFLDARPEFKKVKEFGQWVLYEFENEHSPVAVRDYFYEVLVQSKEKFFEPVTLPPVKLDDKTVLLETSTPRLESRRKGIAIIPECIHCLLPDRVLFPLDRNQFITAGSVFFPWQLEADAKLISLTNEPSRKLETTGIIALKRLYQVQNQIIRKATVDDRILGWEAFVKSLDEEQTALENYFSSLKGEYSYKDNQFLARIFENVDQTREELQFGMKEVNQEAEAAVFLEAKSKLDHLRSSILTYLWYAIDNTDKRFLIETKKAGQYDVYLKNMPSNPLLSAENLETSYLILDDKKIPIQISEQNDKWIKLAKLSFKSGLSRLILHVPEVRTYLIKDKPLTFDFGGDFGCNEMPIGKLPSGAFMFEINATSTRDVTDVYVFIDTKSSTRQPLPFWGRPLPIDAQRIKYLNFKEQIANPDEYVIRFCRLATTAQTPLQIEFNQLYYSRLSEPVIVLYQSGTVDTESISTLSVSSNERNQTRYDITLSGKGESLLMFDQRYDSGWRFSQNHLIFDHQRVHGYANGWSVVKTTDEPVTLELEYISQRLSRYGWYITLGSVLTLGSVGLVVYGKRRHD